MRKRRQLQFIGILTTRDELVCLILELKSFKRFKCGIDNPEVCNATILILFEFVIAIDFRATWTEDLNA